MTNAEELADWIRLMDAEGVGPQTACELLVHFGSPSEIFDAGFSALQKCVPEKIAHVLCAPISEVLQARIERTLAWTAHPDNHVLTLAHRHYPKSLLNISGPPPLLYAKGDVSLLSCP
jgi:DNA processing protein